MSRCKYLIPNEYTGCYNQCKRQATKGKNLCWQHRTPNKK